jgi:2-isopropylmalate synthase
MLRERVPNSDQARFSVHCHNDLGMAVAEFARRRRRRRAADRVHHQRHRRARRQRRARRGRDGDAACATTCCRTGPGIDSDHVDACQPSSSRPRPRSRCSFNKAIVGRKRFAHESGIHQDGMLKHTQTYEIMTPETVGVKQTSLVMGKHSGRHAFVHKLEELGFKLADNQLEDAFVRFKALADRKKQIYDETSRRWSTRRSRTRRTA